MIKGEAYTAVAPELRQTLAINTTIPMFGKEGERKCCFTPLYHPGGTISRIPAMEWGRSGTDDSS